MRRLALATTLCCLLAPAAAEAASVVVVRGAGFGHGIGMSQYGAYGYAKKGVKWQAILAHYYTGTSLSNAPSRPVRVLLRSGASSMRFRGASVGPGGRKLNPAKTYTVSAAGRRVRLRGVGTFNAPLRVKRSGGTVQLLGTAINGVNGGRYRGTLEFRGSGGVTAVNSLPIDSYARGVIAGEMPSGWSMDALRAQAVAARTYALATRNTKGGAFDLYPDTRSQVYNGVRGETARTNLAVRQTANKIVTYKGKIATTYFFSTSGGRTENIENSFLGSTPQPWLKSVDDPYDGLSPKHRWTRRFSPSSFGSRLGVPGAFRSIKVLKRGRSPRVVQARITGSGGSKTITGPQIRARLGLYDTWASFTTVGSSQARTPTGMARTAQTHGWLAGRFDPAPRGRELTLERRARRVMAAGCADLHGRPRALPRGGPAARALPRPRGRRRRRADPRPLAEFVRHEPGGDQVAAGVGHADLAEAEAAPAPGDPCGGDHLLASRRAQEVDGQRDGRADRVLRQLCAGPGGGGRGHVDQRRDGAAVHGVSDRHHLLAEGQRELDVIRLDRARLDSDVRGEGRVLDELLHQLDACVRGHGVNLTVITSPSITS